MWFAAFNFPECKEVVQNALVRRTLGADFLLSGRGPERNLHQGRTRTC